LRDELDDDCDCDSLGGFGCDCDWLCGFGCD
jgi:hypothetical protein